MGVDNGRGRRGVAPLAHRAGLTPAEIASLTHGHADDPCWTTGRERALIQVADALHDSSDINDELRQAAHRVLDEP